jgi:sulfide:quinone oxidoreductase
MGPTDRILIAGGGLAALEAVLALRGETTAEDLPITMLAPEASFAYRPMATRAAVGHGSHWGLDLARFAVDHRVELVADALGSVDVDAQIAITGGGERLQYSALLVAVGATRRPWLPGAIVFGLTEPGAGIPSLLRDLEHGTASHVAFVVPADAFWPPLVYELALLTAEYVHTASLVVTLSLVTQEPAPLAGFGPRASLAMAQRLRRDRVEVRTGAVVDTVEADRVVTLPALSGPAIDGLAADPDGFLPIDERARVCGTVNVYGAGDAVACPIKQAGLTARQADAAADSILADRGFRSRHRRPPATLDGILTPDADLLDWFHYPRWTGAGDMRPRSIWWPPPEISARRVSPYLRAVHGDWTAGDESRPAGIPVSLDLSRRGSPSRRHSSVS